METREGLIGITDQHEGSVGAARLKVPATVSVVLLHLILSIELLSLHLVVLHATLQLSIVHVLHLLLLRTELRIKIEVSRHTVDEPFYPSSISDIVQGVVVNPTELTDEEVINFKLGSLLSLDGQHISVVDFICFLSRFLHGIVDILICWLCTRRKSRGRMFTISTYVSRLSFFHKSSISLFLRTFPHGLNSSGL